MLPSRIPDHHAISIPADTVSTNVVACSISTPAASSPLCCALSNNVSIVDDQST